MNYLANMYRRDEDDDEPHACRYCGGKGYIPRRGEHMAADPCGHCDPSPTESESAALPAASTG
jgi:hypothetical protein